MKKLERDQWGLTWHGLVLSQEGPPEISFLHLWLSNRLAIQKLSTICCNKSIHFMTLKVQGVSKHNREMFDRIIPTVEIILICAFLSNLHFCFPLIGSIYLTYWLVITMTNFYRIFTGVNLRVKYCYCFIYVARCTC